MLWLRQNIFKHFESTAARSTFPVMFLWQFRMSDNNWAVFRQDFTGNEFLVEKNLTAEQANSLVAEFESHKHHQHYWASQIVETPPNYAQMLADTLASGSPFETSLAVLRNQNATIVDCIWAVSQTRSLNLPEAKRIVLESSVFSDEVASEPFLALYIDKALDAET